MSGHHADNESSRHAAAPGRAHGWITHLAGAGLSGGLLAGYALIEGAWALGLVALLPWLLVLDGAGRLRAALGSAWLMSVLMALGVFHWFGAAFAAYVGWGAGWGLLALALLAPLLQPQLFAFVLARQLIGHRLGPTWAALGGACAWVGCEWLWPKLLGDTLGHGLQPALALRQFADLGGAAGLSLWLLLVNECGAAALRRARPVPSLALRPLATGAVLVALVWAYGAWRLDALRVHQSEPAPSLRVGLVQANLTEVEALRERVGSFEAVRQVLGTHFAMSAHAVREQGAEALLWSETVYPTTFGSPKSDDGRAFDSEILGFSATLGVPLVFGTYDRDAAGEYNAAAVVDPQRGLLGHYRKTHPFPLTEWVPARLDGPRFRSLLPWAGSWRAGDGPRVFPLRTADGREASVLPLICLDDVRPQLAINGARLGAEAILGLSNDAWFTGYPAGARLHLAVASFRSIETRLPQLRVTTNGLSALIDETGGIVARTGMGQQAVLVGEIPLRAPPPTLMMRWGDWAGAFALGVLALIVLLPWLSRGPVGPASPAPDAVFVVSRLSTPWRLLTALLRVTAALGLVWIALRMATRDGWQVNSVEQIRLFAATVLAPALAAWAIERAFAMRAVIEAGKLVIEQPALRIEFPLSSLRALQVWRWPLPGPGLRLRLASGRLWSGWRLDDPLGFRNKLQAGGALLGWDRPGCEERARRASQRARARHRWLDHAAVKFALFPLLTALPAFRLHQHIAFGGTFGELLTYGVGAWLGGLLIWWVAWMLGLMLLAAALRIAIEAAVWVAERLGAAAAVRLAGERFGRLVYFLGVPVWFAIRVLAG
ncbi:apolipoprotein N-acyltransferase [Pseudomarimonas salicorniae]|uniref:Apolipoprotein N-acyltransferase n=1 Tax=Pseudomarimonas salicorniae TaxID=2933270 RepID=A0ABT0GER0_9GAMM|nr:apolipoprotein N-acyltransferase [Lysobacter sp. CAU 1642]MCK7593034.1 apolipoprotein N-acyltransferase [Lysobacter sp. CAU 1642]